MPPENEEVVEGAVADEEAAPEAAEGSSDMQEALEEDQAKARSVGGLKAQITRLRREKAELQAELDSLK